MTSSPSDSEGNAQPRVVPATTRAEALKALRRTFAEAGLETPDLDARVLLTEALRIGATDITVRPDVPLGREGAERLAVLARRRLAREPVGRVLGRREFWGLSFDLSPATLEPRPDTETVVEAALSFMADRQADLRILDLGTGTGCLLIALLHELPRASGIGIDRLPGALATARRNALHNSMADRATFVASDWVAALRGGFDLIVSNPPYIATPDLPGLAPEVRDHDPPAALDGGPDGLAAYRIIFGEAAGLLTPDGTLVVEIGSTQEQAARRLAEAAELTVAKVAHDLAGHPRAIVLKPRK